MRNFGDGLVSDGFKQLSSESCNRAKFYHMNTCVIYTRVFRVPNNRNSMNYLSALDHDK